MTVLIVFGLLLIITLSALKVIDSNNKIEEMRIAVSENSDFKASKVIEDKSALFHFAKNEEKQEVFCYSKSNKVRFHYRDIVAVEIQEDGVTTVSSKSASLGGAIAGGVITGGIVTVIGGSSMGKTKSKKKVSSIKVHILLRNCSVDSFDISCMCDMAANVKTSDPCYTKGYANAQKIYDALMLAMYMVKERTVQPQVIVLQKSSIEELKELAELKQQGLITEEEFATMKEKIINK